ncbi:MAG: hypothetical protein SGI86_11650 [Deltaproteobacteria bacterium]|mgnify:CR=1 FL=1|nr:hypothetical protein [Deltaproteobacteria bacterium]
MDRTGNAYACPEAMQVRRLGRGVMMRVVVSVTVFVRMVVVRQMIGCMISGGGCGLGRHGVHGYSAGLSPVQV